MFNLIFNKSKIIIKLQRQIFTSAFLKQQESEMNGIQSLTLPSITEDDENDPEEGETSPLSPHNRSPMHAISSPRHAKFK